MTEIPGTAIPKAVTSSQPPAVAKTKMPLANLPIHEDEMQVMNTEEQAKTDTKYIDDGDEKNLSWNQTLLAWMSFGTALGVLVSLVGFKITNLLVLAPLGPTIGAAAWFVKKYAGKHLRKFDTLK